MHSLMMAYLNICEFIPYLFLTIFTVQPSRIALKSGYEGIVAITTIMSVMGIDLTGMHMCNEALLSSLSRSYVKELHDCMRMHNYEDFYENAQL